ncbi:dual specificity protein kinase splA-like [Heracleum sosnowskyi]|uniref:Dual specificity protein kinase splA-like n=1 Tax=Heracleum sosnowskyi TaxID=360622 RepID=A0AAD8HJR8_9APIA|nr:dual specificity protein kinase splA-like [Heracleum sosnowskyi]
MCSSKLKLQETGSFDINGRPVLQPTCNRVPLIERRNSLKKNSAKSVTPPPKIQPLPSKISTNTTSTNASPKVRPSVITPPISPKLKSPRQPAIKRGNDPNGLSSSSEKVVFTPRSTVKVVTPVKKSKTAAPSVDTTTLNYSSSSIVEAPGSIAAARREQVANMQVQRKSKIAHYGRTKSSRYEPATVPLDDATTTAAEEKRCSFITSNSDPIYVAYHDEEWGVPAHDDRLLFELLVLTGAQVGSDWTSVLKKRQEFRDAFSEFDADIVSKYSEKKITSISTQYSIALSQVRGIVDNSIRILQIKKDFGSFDKYLWGFVNYKPIMTQYKSSHKMPVKTSKSEGISKDMVKKGFRLVGPTVIHSFMQAAGLTNDHLTTCPQHLQCLALASQTGASVAPAL